MQPFNESESAFSPTAGVLSNSNSTQGLSFPTWGDPERAKLNEISSFVNSIQGDYL